MTATAVSPVATCNQIVILQLQYLSLHNFRNYTSARFEVCAGPVVLSGRNGAGKTNILEAISLLTPGRGMRKSRLGEMDAQGQDQPWVITATVHGLQGEVKIGTGRDPENMEQSDKRLIRIDGKQAKSHAELARHLAIIWLTPQMEQLFNQGTSEGRKFLDRLVYSFDSEHASRINEYEYAMRERNRLLADGRADAIWLDALEQTMAETGAAVAQARLSAIESLNHAISLSKNSFPKAHISTSGVVEEMLYNGLAAVDAEDGFRKLLYQSRRQDAAAGRTLSGTHRSEMRVLHTEKQMPAEACSTGEQKAMLLSMVLAQARAAMLWKGVVPVLLLDEVAAHLDTIRRLELFEEICQIGAQVWMTGTDPKFFEELAGKAQFFEVENGQVF
ncbi:MAG: DNA replication/repair protein RecF [Alphaproteobacteria bacterium]